MKKILFLLLLLFPSLVFAQNLIPLQLPNKPVANNSLVALEFDIKTAVPWRVSIDGYQTVEFGTLYYRPRIIKSSYAETTYRFRITYRATKTGYFHVGGFTVKTVEDTLQVGKGLLEVGVETNRGIEVPLNISWQVDENFHYQHEAFPVSLVIKDTPYINLAHGRFEISSNFNSRYLTIEEIATDSSATNPILTREVGPLKLYSYAVQTFLLSYSRTGDLNLPSGTYVKERFSQYVRLGELQIIPTEVEEVESAIVGRRYQYEASISENQATLGDEVSLYAIISGIGNFQNEISLVPTDNTLSFSAPEVQIDKKPTSNGYEGVQVLHWRISPDNIGSYQVELPSITYFDLDKKAHVILKGYRFNLKVSPLPIQAISTNPIDNFTIEPASKMLKEDSLQLDQQVENYALYLPAVILFIAGLFVARPKKIKMSLFLLVLLSASFFMGSNASPREQAMEEVVAHFNEEEFALAKEKLLTLESENNKNSSVLYNLSLVSYLLGEQGDAIYYGRMAVYQKTSCTKYRDWVNLIEDDYGLLYQKDLPMSYSLEIVFILNLILVNLVGIFFFVGSFIKYPKWIITIVLTCGLATTFLHAWNFISYLDKQELMAVVAEDNKSLLKFHKVGAEAVYELPEGTTVKIIGEYEDFYIVSNKLGLEGWVEKESLRLMDQH